MAQQGRETEQYLESLVASLTGWSDPQTRLAQAFERNEFILFGQDIVPIDPKSGIPLRLEVLVRMREEEQNLTPPGAFIPYMEHFGMMMALDLWVVEHAIGWWLSRDGGRAPLNINLSVEALIEPSFHEYVMDRVGRSAIPAGTLLFELEAKDVMAQAEKAQAAAARLRALGCGFAITGFGRDLVSFEALKAIGGSMIKLDSTLTMNLHRDPVAFAKVKSIQSVCAKSGVLTVAEWVELPETVDKLRGIGFNYVQGYGLAHPAPLAGMDPLKEARSTVTGPGK